MQEEKIKLKNNMQNHNCWLIDKWKLDEICATAWGAHTFYSINVHDCDLFATHALVYV